MAKLTFQLEGSTFKILPKTDRIEIHKDDDNLVINEQTAKMIYAAWTTGYMRAYDENKEARSQAAEYSWVKNPESMGQ